MGYRKNGKRVLALLLGAALFLGMLAGCRGRPEDTSRAPAESLIPLENSGTEVKLVLAGTELGEGYQETLEEIARKYQADFPNTQVVYTPCATQEEAQALLRAGQADLVQVTKGQQPAWVAEGLLWDFRAYLPSWREESTLTNASRQVLASMGKGHAYVMPADFTQKVLFYRQDWFEAYNADKQWDEEKAWCRSWGQILTAQERLGKDKAMMAMAGEDSLAACFDAMLWSIAGRGSMIDPAAAYFTAGGEPGTLFSREGARMALEQLQEFFQEACLPGCETWTQEQATEAFLSGKAGLLLADSSLTEELDAALPPGALGVEGFVKGNGGTAVFEAGFWGWGISSQSAHKEDALHFLTFLSSADNNTRLAAVTGALPIHSEGLNMEPSLLEGPRRGEARMIAKAGEYQYASRPAMCQGNEAYEEKLTGLLQGFLSGEIGGDPLLEELDSYWLPQAPLALYKENNAASLAGLIKDSALVEFSEETARKLAP